MSPPSEVVVAGGGVAGAATALRLRQLGFGVRMLVRREGVLPGIEALPERALALLDVIGEPQLVADAGGLAVGGDHRSTRRVHVERRALARTFLDRARTRGAVVAEIDRLPAVSDLAPAAIAVIDATGRAAAWSRPLVTDGHDVAWQFEGAPRTDPTLRMVQGDGWWAYRLGTASTTWAGVVIRGTRDAVSGEEPGTEEALRSLGLEPSAMAPRGRRAARVQRAVRPAEGHRISVGDAALAHDPVAGAGIRFALASAIAAATAVATRVAARDHGDHADAYYNDLVGGEHDRHLAARRAIHDGESRAVVEAPPASPEPASVPEVVCFTAAIVATSLALDGLIGPGDAVRLSDGTLTRWLGSFDLLVLARLASRPIPRVVLLAQLQGAGLDVASARAVLSWAVAHGVLTG